MISSLIFYAFLCLLWLIFLWQAKDETNGDTASEDLLHRWH
jgi:hypothetical protein